jgi:hypothetical protein
VSGAEHSNARLLREFHERQNEFYAGGDQAPAAALLAPDVTWHVPGRSALAGDHHGRDAVLRYFAARRELARQTFRISVREAIAGDERAVILAACRVQRDGAGVREWETASVFRLADGQIAECWVLPYDQYAYDAIWA